MARLILSLCFALVSLVSSVWGQNSPPSTNLNPCTGLPATAPYYTDIDLTKPWPVCQDPTFPRVDANSAGIVGWRWCRTPAGKHWPQWAVVPWSDFSIQPSLALQLTAAGLSINEEALVGVVTKYKDLIQPLSHPSNAAVWCPAWPKIAASRPADILPVVWIVAKNSTYPTRPTYPVVDKVRVPVSNGRVSVGIDCDVTAAIIEGPSTYGRPATSTLNTVALCVKK